MVKLVRHKAIRMINHYFKAYKSLPWSLIHLSVKVTDELSLRHIKYPDPIKDLILGFRIFNTPSLLITRPKKDIDYINETDPLYKFFMFIYIFGGVLDKCDEKYKQYLLERLNKICVAPTTPKRVLTNFRAFYHEIKTFFSLFYDGCSLRSLPEAHQSSYSQNISLSEAIFINPVGREFQLECKSISSAGGHPIAEITAKKFIRVLQDDPIYKELFPSNTNFCVEFMFDRKIGSNSLTAEDMLNNIKQGHDVRLLKSKNIRILTPEEDKQKWSITLKVEGKNIRHQIILFSSSPNTWEDIFKDKIEEEIKKKKERGLSFPTLYSVEIYGPPLLGGQYQMHLFSEEIQLKSDNELSTDYYTTISWDKIMLRVFQKSGIIENF